MLLSSRWLPVEPPRCVPVVPVLVLSVLEVPSPGPVVPPEVLRPLLSSVRPVGINV
jgi:hypothetical protein